LSLTASDLFNMSVKYRPCQAQPYYFVIGQIFDWHIHSSSLSEIAISFFFCVMNLNGQILFMLQYIPFISIMSYFLHLVFSLCIIKFFFTKKKNNNELASPDNCRKTSIVQLYFENRLLAQSEKQSIDFWVYFLIISCTVFSLLFSEH
jgi:purine-cytosine permease-like protein